MLEQPSQLLLFILLLQCQRSQNNKWEDENFWVERGAEERKLSTNGKKDLLQGRLLGDLHSPVGGLVKMCSGFSRGAKWQLLKHCNQPVEEPNKDSRLRDPTIAEGESDCKEHDYEDGSIALPLQQWVYELSSKGLPLCNGLPSISHTINCRKAKVSKCK